MSDESVFSPNEATVKNLISLAREQSLLEERRICELYEMAEHTVDFLWKSYGRDMNIYEILSLASEVASFVHLSVHTDHLPKNAHRLGEYLGSLLDIDKTLFCEMIYEALSKKTAAPKERDFLPCENSSETFVYVKNTLADEAYDVFSQDFSDPRIRYAQSFKEALRLISEGAVSYCLLPFEERGGARLSSISELISSHDLKINAVTPVFGFDGSADMKYALVSKSFSVPELNSEDDRYLEIRLPAETDITLGTLLSAAERFHHSIYRVETLNLNIDGERKSYYTVVFRDEGHDFSLLLIYLMLFTSECTPVGIYKNQE